MAFTGLGGGLFKGLFTSDKDIYGTKPVIPPYDPFGSYNKTIGENIKLAPQAMKLANLTNQYNLGTRTGLFEQLVPGYTSTLSTVAANQAARARGEIAPDVLSRIARQGQAWRVGSGTGRAPIGNLRDLRNYGLTSMDVSRQGENDIANWLRLLAQTSMPEAVDIRDYSINPAARLQDEFAREKAVADIAASPDPGKRGQFDSAMALLGMVLSAYGGGAGYTGKSTPINERGFGYGIGGSAPSTGGGSWWSRAFRPTTTQNNYSPGFNTEDYLSSWPGAG